ncbi:MAG: FHA domain-containing protein [Arenicellales bacterium]|nr:FHA domain-containing protein [Arenicellales bacterium]
MRISRTTEFGWGGAIGFIYPQVCRAQPFSDDTMAVLHIAQWVVIALLLVMTIWLWRRGSGKPAHPYAYLYRLSHNRPVRFDVTREVCRIGRHPHNDLKLTDKSVSRFHAELVRNRNGSFTVFDGNSKNGIRVGSRPVRSGVLREGDLIHIGNVQLKFTRYPKDFLVHHDTTMIEESPARFNGHRRRAQRTDATMKVRLYNDEAGWASGRVTNLGADGVFIKTSNNTLAPRMPVDMVFPIVDGRYRRWLRLSAEVVRRDKKGVAVSFTDNDPVSRELLQGATLKVA